MIASISWPQSAVNFFRNRISCKKNGNNKSVCSEIMLKIIILKWNTWAALITIVTSHLIFMMWETFHFTSFVLIPDPCADAWKYWDGKTECLWSTLESSVSRQSAAVAINRRWQCRSHFHNYAHSKYVGVLIINY